MYFFGSKNCNFCPLTELTVYGFMFSHFQGTVVSFNPEVSAYDPDVNVNSVITYSIPEDTHNGNNTYSNSNWTLNIAFNAHIARGH